MDERTVKRLFGKINQNGPAPEHRPELGPCWIWRGKPGSRGYCYFWYDGKKRLAHRFCYEVFVGPIPEGLVIDHLCRNTICVRGSHLEPVTDRINIARGTAPPARNMVATECSNGHPFNEENTYVYPNGERGCRTCIRKWNQEWRAENRPSKGGRGSHQTAKTHCPKGHPYDEVNTILKPGGGRGCRACTRIRNREAQRRRRAKAREQPE